MLSSLPDSTQLTDWMNPDVVSEVMDGNTEAFRVISPFPHILIPQFLRPEVYAALSAAARSIAPETMEEHAEKYGFLAFSDKKFLRFMYGAAFRSFMERLSGLSLRMSDDYPYPHVHRFAPASSGLNIHTDWGSDRALATLLYLNDGWHPGMGGELGLTARWTDYLSPRSLSRRPATPLRRCRFRQIRGMPSRPWSEPGTE